MFESLRQIDASHHSPYSEIHQGSESLREQPYFSAGAGSPKKRASNIELTSKPNSLSFLVLLIDVGYCLNSIVVIPKYF